MSVELIAALSDPMVRELANRGSVRSFPKNTVIITAPATTSARCRSTAGRAPRP